VVKADTYTGYLWINVSAASDATVAQATTLGLGTANIVFTTTAINFDLGGPQAPATVQQFLNANSAAINFVSGNTAANLNATFTTNSGPNALIDGGYILFTGTTGLTAGSNSFSVSHDDGAELAVNGSTVFSSPGPQSEGPPSTGTYNAATSGNYGFELAYGEVNGTPAVIQFSPTLATPEPSTLAIAGLGALGFGAYHYRRRRAAKASA